MTQKKLNELRESYYYGCIEHAGQCAYPDPASIPESVIREFFEC